MSTEKNLKKEQLILMLFPLFSFVIIIVSFNLFDALSTTDAPQTSDALPDIPDVESRLQGLAWSAPDFTLPSLSQERVRLSDYSGRVVFLNFWQTTCPGCVEEFAVFEAFSAAHPDVVLLAVNGGETSDEINRFMREHGIAQVVTLLDADFSVFDRYGVVALPVTYVIDTTGTVRKMHLGAVEYDDLEADLRMLTQAPPDVTS